MVLDFKTGRVIWLGKDRKTKTFNNFFFDRPKTELNQIEAIAKDMWDPFIKSVRKNCPQAIIVFVKYHLVASYNRDAIDEVRRSEQRTNQRITPNIKSIKVADGCF